MKALRAARVPLLGITNGGGTLEADKAASLSVKMGVPFSADQVILSHTPMRSLAARHGKDLVLVSGTLRAGRAMHIYTRTAATLARAHMMPIPMQARRVQKTSQKSTGLAMS